MKRWGARVGFLGALVLVTGLLPVGLASAATLPQAGTAVQVGGLDDFLTTLWDYLAGNMGRAVGAAIAVTGLVKHAKSDGRTGSNGTGAMLSGAGIAFVPTTIDTLFTAAPAAVWGLASTTVPAWAQMLYAFTGGHALKDPVTLVAMALMIALVASRQRRLRPVAV